MRESYPELGPVEAFLFRPGLPEELTQQKEAAGFGTRFMYELVKHLKSLPYLWRLRRLPPPPEDP